MHLAAVLGTGTRCASRLPLHFLLLLIVVGCLFIHAIFVVGNDVGSSQ
jgi:hypothetical protein